MTQGQKCCYLLLISFSVCVCTMIDSQFYKLVKHPVSGLKMCPFSNELQVLTSLSNAECAVKCLQVRCSIFEFIESNRTCKLYDEFQKKIPNYKFSETCTAMGTNNQCDIQLIGLNSNLAYLKTGRMSSITTVRYFSYAVDGYRLGYWTNTYKVAATTNTLPVEWMVLDLGYNFIVKNIALWPRADGNMYTRISNLSVTMSRESTFYTNPLSASKSYPCGITYYDVAQGYVNASCMNCDKGFRYIALIANRSESEIDLAEIEVYGQPENCAFIFTYLNPWNKCMLLLNISLTWDESVIKCQNNAAIPIYLNSLQETKDVLSFGNAIKLPNATIVWTGGYWNNNSLSWSWWGKQNNTWQVNWQSGEPGDARRCVALNLTSLGAIVQPCDAKFCSICQIQLNSA